MTRTTEDRITQMRAKEARVRKASEAVVPWLHHFTERGREIARTSISELDITAQFEETEDMIIALFSSLACQPNNETFASSDIFRYTSPEEMLRRRLFTDIEPFPGLNRKRFSRLMDTLWMWCQDYGDVVSVFETLSHDPDPSSTLQWMIGKNVDIPDADYRIPRFLMALMLYDNGIGQGLVPHFEPECLVVPECLEVRTIQKVFCNIRNVERGHLANILHLSYETDLYYLALGWKEACSIHPNETRLFTVNYHKLIDCSTTDRYQRASCRRYLNMIAPHPE